MSLMLVAIFIRILEAMFLVGMAGAAVVFAMTTVEDIQTMFEPDEH